MNFHALLARIAKILNDFEIPYAVMGGYAVSEFNFVYPESNLKVDFFVAGSDQFNKQKLARRISLDINGEKVNFVSPEDLILSKLLWYKSSHSNRQLEDAESVLKIQKDKLDFNYLKKWTSIQETDKILEPLLNN